MHLLPSGHCFVVSKYLICQLVDKLIKAEIHLKEEEECEGGERRKKQH